MSFHAVKIAREAAVVAVAILLLNIAMCLQIGESTLDRTFGEAEIRSDGLDPRPTFALGGRNAFEIHIDRLGPMRQAVVGIDRVKKADSTTSYVLTYEAGVSVIA